MTFYPNDRWDYIRGVDDNNISNLKTENARLTAVLKKREVEIKKLKTNLQSVEQQNQQLIEDDIQSKNMIQFYTNKLEEIRQKNLYLEASPRRSRQITNSKEEKKSMQTRKVVNKTRDREPSCDNGEENSMKPTKTMLLTSVAHGVKVAAADEASEILIMLVENLIGEAYPGFARSERGKDFVKIVAALALHYVATNYEEMIPQAEGVASACGLVVEASARDIIQPQLKKLQPLLSQLAELGDRSNK